MFVRAFSKVAHARSVAARHSPLRRRVEAIARPLHLAALPRWSCFRASARDQRRSFGDLSGGDPPSESATLPPGVESSGDKLVMLYTCTVCETRSAKTISKHAYNNGVVLVRCPGCENLHLVADRLGWFEDDSTDVESLLKAKGEKIKIVTSADVLELTDIEILKQSIKDDE